MSSINVDVFTGDVAEVEADTLVLNWFADERDNPPTLWKELDHKLGGALAVSIKDDTFKGEPYEIDHVQVTDSKLKVKRIVLICSGKRDTFWVQRLRNVAAAGVRAARNRGAKKVAVALYAPGVGVARLAQAVTDAGLTAPTEPDLYRTQARELRRISDVIVVVPDGDKGELKKGVQRGAAIAAGIEFTRSLAEEPANIMTPVEAAERTRKMAHDAGLEVEVFDDDEITKREMLSLLSVSFGSQWPARVVTLRYRGDRGSDETLALVGKGVTFDTGGISIKPADSMHLMKYDMSGAAAVVGAMLAIAKLQPKVNVIGVIGLVENMPGGKANKPGDVIRAANGKTIEILNTDAEGRMVLADVLDLARKMGATRIVDAATLTGAMVIALGHYTTGVMGQPQDWVDQILTAGRSAGERVWQMPLFPEYKTQIESQIADLANTGGRPAGSITAAMFLKEFVGDTPWVHFDIAGTADNQKDLPYTGKGSTGAAVRTFVELASPSPQ